jgi:hypothetical protein
MFAFSLMSDKALAYTVAKNENHWVALQRLISASKSQNNSRGPETALFSTLHQHAML